MRQFVCEVVKRESKVHSLKLTKRFCPLTLSVSTSGISSFLSRPTYSSPLSVFVCVWIICLALSLITASSIAASLGIGDEAGTKYDNDDGHSCLQLVKDITQLNEGRRSYNAIRHWAAMRKWISHSHWTETQMFTICQLKTINLHLKGVFELLIAIRNIAF